MLLNFHSLRFVAKRFSLLVLALAFVLAISATVWAQSTVSTGSIVGTVTDPSRAVVSGAKVSISNMGTGQKIDLVTNTSGAYNSGSLAPGEYKLQVSSKGFRTVIIPVTVQVGNTSNGNVNLELGQETQVIEVQGSDVQVNTQEEAVQGVLTSNQIENLPINGRNFLDLAQLEPGVQIQDGQNFDPTKAGYSSISFGGRFGRTARINVDGVDVSDETVGTTTADIPASAIDEFQLSQSSLDLTNDLTSSGAINVTTKSGTNSFHGEAFGFFRDHHIAAASLGGKDLYFQRSQYGGRFGGPIVKDKFFLFMDGERTTQNSFAPVVLSGTPFAGVGVGFSQPFREDNLLGKVDYDLGHGARAFYRYSYFKNSLLATFGLGFSVYDNKDVTRQHTGGFDFSSGTFNHSIRFSYLKFQNQIVDATLGNNALPLCCTGLLLSSSSFFAGPNLLAPQSTPQSNRQIKYDGTKALHNHTLRYGVSFNHIQGGGFADFYGTAPRVSWTTNATNEAFANAGPFPGGDTNPLNYPVSRLRVGNGQGFSTLQPALGFPAGGLGPDNRLGLYVGDNWKIRPNFSLNLGLRYDRDTGRTDSDLPADPAINAAFPGAGNRVKQANLNFAPQLGFAWDLKGNGKTVIRGGIGLFYENVIFNNVLFDRPDRLQTGAFNAVTSACFQSTPNPVPVAGGTITPSGICGQTVGSVIPQILAFWDQVKAGNPLDLKAPNPNYIGNLLSAGLGIPLGLFGPDYKSPRALQMNVGIQREIRRGMVFSADYLRNIETRSLLGVDINHVGDIKNFNLTAATNAVNATNASFGCPAGQAGVGCAIAAGASMVDYACGAACGGTGPGGLTADTDFGQACIQALGVPCAFPGKNPNQQASFLLSPIGRSVYNALQMKLVQNVKQPMRGVKALNFQTSYSLSRFSNTGGAQLTGTPGDSDQDFVLQTPDNNSPGRYFGPAILDRLHQISFGGFADLPGGFRLGLLSHFYSPLSSALVAPNSASAGEIFRTDFTGDGSVGDPIPGTHFGQFDRGINASQLTSVLNKYNSATANQATPAGQVLMANNLMSLTQLQALGGVAPHICLAPPAVDNDPSCSPNSPGSQVNFTWLRAMDLKLSWRHTFKERFTIEPSVGFYNVANFSNFNLPPNTMNGLMSGAGSGAINGTTRSDNESFRVGNGTGVYSLGSQRQMEFGLRFVF